MTLGARLERIVERLREPRTTHGLPIATLSFAPTFSGFGTSTFSDTVLRFAATV